MQEIKKSLKAQKEIWEKNRNENSKREVEETRGLNPNVSNFLSRESFLCVFSERKKEKEGKAQKPFLAA